MRKLLYLLLFLPLSVLAQNQQVKIWERLELTFTSSKAYSNPVQDLKEFQVIFQSPTGREKRINGFWDGENLWKARFMPDSGTVITVTSPSDTDFVIVMEYFETPVTKKSKK